MGMIHLFAYGSLKPGEPNYPYIARFVVAQEPAIAWGQLFHLPLGYPAMAAGEGRIEGYRLAFADDRILADLDEFERHDPEELARLLPALPAGNWDYQRQAIPVFTPNGQARGTAWAYTMPLVAIQQLGGIHLPLGCWQAVATAHLTGCRGQNH